MLRFLNASFNRLQLPTKVKGRGLGLSHSYTHFYSTCLNLTWGILWTHPRQVKEHSLKELCLKQTAPPIISLSSTSHSWWHEGFLADTLSPEITPSSEIKFRMALSHMGEVSHRTGDLENLALSHVLQWSLLSLRADILSAFNRTLRVIVTQTPQLLQMKSLILDIHNSVYSMATFV